MVVAAVLFALAPIGAKAQFGPMQARGYVEYQYQQRHMEGGRSYDTHAASLRTDFSTFFWRPWMAQVSGTLVTTQRKTLLDDRRDKNSLIQGGLRLYLLPKSRYPLTMFYEQFDNYGVNGPNVSDGNRTTYGFLQQLSSRRLGAYSLEYRNTEYDTLYSDGYIAPNQSNNRTWRSTGRRSFGNNTFYLNSSLLEADSQAPDSYRDFERHALRHNYRAGQRVTVQNSLFYNDELSEFGDRRTLRQFSQLSSTATWRPATERRLLVSGRGLFQNTATNGDTPLRKQDRAYLSVAANYQLTDNVTLFGNAGYSNTNNDMMGGSDSTFQQVGTTYISDTMRLAGGSYNYNGRLFVGNRNDSTSFMAEDLQGMNADIDHSFTRPFNAFNDLRFNFRVSQQLLSNRDSDGRERNSLRHAVQLSTSGSLGELGQYFRIGLIDQRDYGDQRRVYQLGDVAYSLQGNIDRNRSWNLNLNAQYGFREQDKPLEMAEKSRSSSYSASMLYRHSDLFEVPLLDFTSDLRIQSDDYRSDDPFDIMPGLENDRVSSSWRNQLDYRLGLLQMRASVDLYDSNGTWNTVLNFVVRRYFGFN